MAVAALIDMTGGTPTLPALFAPVMLAGTLGGALLGPRAVRDDWVATARSRFGLRMRLALAAILIGAPVVALQLGVDSFLRRDDPSGILGDLIGALTLIPIGIVFYGPFALPFTYAAALVWTWVMRRLALPS